MITITLPPFLALLGIVLGGLVLGALARAVVELAMLVTMDSGPDWIAYLLWPATIGGAVGGWFWLASLL